MSDFAHLDDADGFTPDDRFRDGVLARAASIRRRHRRVRYAAVAAVLLGALLAGGTAGLSAVTPQRLDVTAPGDGDDAVTTFLLAGTDSCSADLCPDLPEEIRTQGRADALMVIRLGPGPGQVEVVSLPRDLWVPGREVGSGKLLASLTLTQRLRYLQDQYGVGVDHYVELDMSGFVQLVDAVGGVDLDVSSELEDRSSGLHVVAGCQHFDGRRLLALVRSRRIPTGEGDGLRVMRQQRVLYATMTSVMRDRDLAQRLPELLSVLRRHAKVDAGFDLATMASALNTLRVANDDIRVYGPVLVRRAEGPNGAQRLAPVGHELTVSQYGYPPDPPTIAISACTR